MRRGYYLLSGMEHTPERRTSSLRAITSRGLPRREALRLCAATVAGGWGPAIPALVPRRVVAEAPAAQPGISGWQSFLQPALGVAFQHPPGWTVRVLESGQAGVSEGADGLSGARAYGQLFAVKEGTGSGTLIYTLAANLALTLDEFRVVEAVRLSASPDLSALRYTFRYVDGRRKGTITVSAKKGGATLLGFDAPEGAYAARVDALSRVIGTFRWFKSSPPLDESVEPRERAYSMMIPQGWRPDLSVIRPQIDAGFSARVTDPAGVLSIEVHRPMTPAFITPHPASPLPEGSWYPLGSKWGMEPLLVYRYLPGKDYVRWFLLPRLQRPGVQIAGWGDRPDLEVSPEIAALKRAFGGRANGGEVEYTWTTAQGVRMRGRAVVQTVLVSGLDRAPSLWQAPLVLLAEAPESQFSTAGVALLAANGSFHVDSKWYAAEIATSRKRWRIIRETEKILFDMYQETLKHRQDVVLKAAEQWSDHIRHTPLGNSDFGAYVPYGNDTIRLADGSIIPVIELGGKTITQWIHDNPDGYLKKAW